MSKASVYVFIISIASIILTRILPHPPNFTSTIAVAVYFPILFGKKNIATVIFAIIISDLILGLHSYIIWTWGSILAISTFSRYFQNLSKRLLASLIFSLFFFITTNFGVWISGQYEYSFQGLALCYFLALPFFASSLASTLFYSVIIESMISSKKISEKIMKINPFFVHNHNIEKNT